MSHHRETVTAVGAPAAAGPYSHAVKSAGLIFLSGQTPLDPPTVAWLMQAALVIGYFASIAVRTLVRGRQVIAFDGLGGTRRPRAGARRSRDIRRAPRPVASARW